MKKLLLCALLTLSPLSQADTIYVVVHQNNPIAGLTQTDVKNIFLAKVKSFPSGGKAVSIDQDKDSPVYAQFYETIIEKKPDQLQTYWSKMVFSGNGEPPKKVGNNGDVLKLVHENPNMIGYVTELNNNLPVKVVYEQ